MRKALAEIDFGQGRRSCREVRIETGARAVSSEQRIE